MYRILYKYQDGTTETSLDIYKTVEDAQEKIRLIRRGPLGGSIMCSIINDHEKIKESTQVDILIDMVKIQRELQERAQAQINVLTDEISKLKQRIVELEQWQEHTLELNRNEY